MDDYFEYFEDFKRRPADPTDIPTDAQVRQAHARLVRLAKGGNEFARQTLIALTKLEKLQKWGARQ